MQGRNRLVHTHTLSLRDIQHNKREPGRVASWLRSNATYSRQHDPLAFLGDLSTHKALGDLRKRPLKTLKGLFATAAWNIYVGIESRRFLKAARNLRIQSSDIYRQRQWVGVANIADTEVSVETDLNHSLFPDRVMMGSLFRQDLLKQHVSELRQAHPNFEIQLRLYDQQEPASPNKAIQFLEFNVFSVS